MKRYPEVELAEDNDDTMSEDLITAGPSKGRRERLATVPVLSSIPDYDSKAALPTMRKLMLDRASSSSVSCTTLHYHRKALRRALRGPLDRVNVLGDDDGTYGHTGCVNALSWAMDGEILLSGGDDTTVRLWKLDPNKSSTPYSYRCDSVIHTGHTGNIFNAHLLPSSSKIATVAADHQVRVFDVERALTTSSQGRETEFSTGQTLQCELRCHTGRTKRIVTEESPDSFLTVGEDGAVRQHDLRTPHRCRRGNCPQPLVKLPFDLSTLALSPLAPYQFVVAGESQFGYLFDRRQVGRTLEAEWGKPPDDEDYVTCVRRFGRQARGPGEAQGAEHVTGARMAETNSYEVLLSYSGDAVYLYSTRDEAELPHRLSAVLSPNAKKQKTSHSPEISMEGPSFSRLQQDDTASQRYRSSSHPVTNNEGDEDNEDVLDFLEVMRRGPRDDPDVGNDEHSADSGEESDVENDEDLSPPEMRLDGKFKTPVIMPRMRFSGHCNIETVKDVNFIGAEDEFVASGSDDGNFFLWNKATGGLHGIYDGDGSVVNVIESHPRLPLIACSGIDTTVKLFAPTYRESKFSKMKRAEDIISLNSSRTQRSLREQMEFSRIFMQYRSAMRQIAESTGSEDSDGPESTARDPQCTFQ